MAEGTCACLEAAQEGTFVAEETSLQEMVPGASLGRQDQTSREEGGGQADQAGQHSSWLVVSWHEGGILEVLLVEFRKPEGHLDRLVDPAERLEGCWCALGEADGSS